MRIEDSINRMDELLDQSWSLPLTNGRCVVDIELMRSIIDDMRENLPVEFQQADNLLVRRDEIINKANQDAENIIRKAEERARVILDKDEAVKAAQQKANGIMTQAQGQAKEMRFASHQFSDNVLKQTEEALYRSLEELRATRQALRSSAKQQD